MCSPYVNVQMGFGSYDESEQEKMEFNADDIVEGERSGEFEGEVSFDVDDSSVDELLEQFSNDVKVEESD